MPGSSSGDSSVAAGAARCSKLDTELARLRKAGLKEAGDQKLSEIYNRFKEDPDSIEQVWVLLFKERQPRCVATDDNHPFSTKYLYLSRVPKTFLQKWMPSVSSLKEADLVEIGKTDPVSLGQALCAGLVQDWQDPIGPLDKGEWKHAAEQRHASLGCRFDKLVLNDGKFDWDKGGLFHLLPERSELAKQDTPLFTKLSFLDMEVTFDEGFNVPSSATILDNWSHSKATLYRQGAVPEKIPCASFFQGLPEFSQRTAPMFSFPEKGKKKAGMGSELARVKRLKGSPAHGASASDTSISPLRAGQSAATGSGKPQPKPKPPPPAQPSKRAGAVDAKFAARRG
jgi:hypothetical protein